MWDFGQVSLSLCLQLPFDSFEGKINEAGKNACFINKLLGDDSYIYEYLCVLNLLAGLLC